MVQETLKVTGMHCPKCDARVEKAVGELAGVESVKATYESDVVEFVYDGSPETLASIKQAIIEQEFAVED